MIQKDPKHLTIKYGKLRVDRLFLQYSK